MLNIDELKLLSGEPIFVENIGFIYQPTLKKIKQVGMNVYYKYLLIITNLPESINDYNELFQIICGYYDIRNEFEKACSFFINEKPNYFDKYKSFAIGVDGFYLNQDNYLDFVNVIKKINGLKLENKKETYADEKAKQIAERMKKAREKREKNNNDESITLDNIISSVASKHPSYNLFNIWDLTVYQLYDQYKRLNMIDQYHVHISAMIQGAEIKDLKHWSSSNKE